MDRNKGTILLQVDDAVYLDPRDALESVRSRRWEDSEREEEEEEEES